MILKIVKLMADLFNLLTPGSTFQLGMGIDNRFQLRTGSNWLNPSTSFAFMLNGSLDNALHNNDVTHE